MRSVLPVRRLAIVLLVAATVAACSGSDRQPAPRPVPKPGTLEQPPIAVDQVFAIDDHRVLAVDYRHDVAVFDFTNSTWTRLPLVPIEGEVAMMGTTVVVAGPEGGFCSDDDDRGPARVVAAAFDVDRDAEWRRRTLDLPEVSCWDWSFDAFGVPGGGAVLRSGRTYFTADRDLRVRQITVPDDFTIGVCPRDGGGFRALVHDPPYEPGASSVDDLAGRVGPDGNLVLVESATHDGPWTRVPRSETRLAPVTGGPATVFDRTLRQDETRCTPRGMTLSTLAAAVEWDGAEWTTAPSRPELRHAALVGDRRIVADRGQPRVLTG